MAFFLWGLLALGLGAALVFSAQLEFLVPAIAAVIVLAIALIPGLSENWLAQTVIWLVLSSAGLVVFRNQLRKLKLGPRKDIADPVAGKTATVIEAFGDDGVGRVRFQGTTWKAISSEQLPLGAEVQILGQEGIVLQVERPMVDPLDEEIKALGARDPKKEG